MKKVFLPLSLLTLLFVATTAQTGAETVTLNSGEVVEGKILSETDSQITVEVKFSESISDERVIQRTDIKNIEKTNPEIGAFAEIKDIKLNPQYSLKPETYSHDIAALSSFLTNFPSSPHATEIKSTLEAFQAEEARAANGEVKFLGKWLSSSEAEARMIQIQGQQSFDAMKAQTNRQDLVGALNTFDLIEKKYSSTRIYPDAIDLARQIVTTLEKQVLNRLNVIAYNQKDFQTELSRAKPEDVPQLREADRREQAQYAAAIAAAKANGLKWPPFIPRSQASMDELQKSLSAEWTRLNALPVEQMHASISLDDEAISAIASHDKATASNLLDDALKAWPKNEEGSYWKTQIGTVEKPTATPTPGAVVKSIQTAAQSGSSGSTTAVVSQEVEKPFYMTVNGAVTIAVAVFAVLGGITLLGRLQNKKPAAK